MTRRIRSEKADKRKTIVHKMSRQGLRSANSGGDQGQEDLDRTLTDTQENRG